MSWTKEDSNALRTYRNIIDSDDIKIKERIKKILLNNRALIHVLDNNEMDEDIPDEYFGENILPYYMISEVQSSSKNYVCFSTQTDELERYNKNMKYMQIVFHVLCNQKDIIEKETGLARHDLLAALIIDDFNWTNYFGGKIHLVSNKEMTVDMKWACRQLVFQQVTDNNVVKTIDGSPRVINKDIHYIVPEPNGN